MNSMGRILIIEDSRVFSAAIGRQLRACHTVDQAGTLAQARAAIAQHVFDAAVVDLHLPDAADGEAVDFVQARGIPVVVFTGAFDPHVRQRILAKGVFDYIPKDRPDAIDAVVQTVDRLFRNADTTLLVVDDSQIARRELAAFLRSMRYQVLEAEHGGVALELLTTHPTIAVVVTDYHMPEVDGFQLVARIRRTRPREELAIVGISGASAAERNKLSVRFLKGGASDFLVKPYSKEELANKIDLHVAMLAQFAELRSQSKRLAALNHQKNRFLGVAAHDLRSPLASVRSSAELLLSKAVAPVSEGQEPFLTMIHTLSNQMLDLVNDLLDVSAIESGKLTLSLTDGSLPQLVAQRVRVSEALAAQKDIALSHVSEDVPLFPFDASRMTQVVDNLLTNAVKFSPPGSPIAVRVAWTPEDRTARLSVADHGPGLTAEDQNRLFGEFQKLSAQPTGGEKSTGLGLSIARKIVEAHGGRIWVDSRAGHGATFSVAIPMGASYASH